ncbi:AraC family transcriptional regulator [Pantoea sp. DY-15]|nr:AraC family transcriptional regulator [Pantoea sp. DY-15]
MVLVESGHGLHVINGKPSYIQEGDVFFVNEGDHHFYDELGTLKLTNVLINRQQDFHFLSNTDTLINRITDIAYMCGFSNSNHFTVCYKHVFGHTPSSERSRARLL